MTTLSSLTATPMQERRRRLGISLRQLAEYTGINRGYLSLWERGRYVPTAEEQGRLTAVLQDFEVAVSARGQAPFLTPAERQERASARYVVSRAIARGELKPGPCERCGAEKTAAHHRDGYADPLRVVWLCGGCHGQEHARMNRERADEANDERRVVKGRAMGHALRKREWEGSAP